MEFPNRDQKQAPLWKFQRGAIVKHLIVLSVNTTHLDQMRFAIHRHHPKEVDPLC